MVKFMKMILVDKSSGWKPWTGRGGGMRADLV